MSAENENAINSSGEGTGAIIKPLIWEHLGGDHYRAMCPLFGNLRIERYGGDYMVNWSVPGYCASFIEGEFDTFAAAVEATQAEYERRLSEVLNLPA
jgi:hypothetical protein